MSNLDGKHLVYKPKNKVRFVTAASLYDGHDASINIMRRIIQGSGCEVIRLGQNRSVKEKWSKNSDNGLSDTSRHDARR